MYENYKNLGFFSPWYTRSPDNKIVSNLNFRDAAELVDDKRINTGAIVSILNMGYSFGDLSIVENIKRSPWMAKPCQDDETQWDFASVPQHGKTVMDASEAGASLFQLLQKELLESIGEKKRVGILLTGGMDSRIVAGALDYLIKVKQLSGVEVIAYTWGHEGCRDVQYAKRIASRMKWDWKHFTVNSEDLLRNIEITAFNGCEFSPLHLHAMPQIAEEKGVECILAGSYGDSIGRGEYSAIKVGSLGPIENGLNNRFGFLNKTAFQEGVSLAKEEVSLYHKRFPRSSSAFQYEQDQQLHYMRRMLNPCMDTINQKIPVYQMFTHPDVFGFMWSLDHQCRTDKVYAAVMELFDTKLHDIPWARTGRPYLNSEVEPDQLSKDHHSYSKIVNEDMWEVLEDEIFSGALDELEVFNMTAITALWKYSPVFNPKDKILLEDKWLWLASLSQCVKQITLAGNINNTASVYDYIAGKTVFPAKVLAYNSYHKFKR